MPEPRAARAVLFDLDGTLADTAPDLGAALNRLRHEQGLPALPVAAVRSYASMGARGLLRAGFGLTPHDPSYETLRDAFLSYYEAHLCNQTRLFPGIPELLAALEARGLLWGVVTNKAMRFTVPIIAALGLEPRAACVVGGDSTPHAKPHPAPLLCAAHSLDIAPARCYYLGDDLRDVQAAHAAGMRAVVVEYGYHGVDGDGPHGWNADAVIARPLDLLPLL